MDLRKIKRIPFGKFQEESVVRWKVVVRMPAVDGEQLLVVDFLTNEACTGYKREQQSFRVVCSKKHGEVKGITAEGKISDAVIKTLYRHWNDYVSISEREEKMLRRFLKSQGTQNHQLDNLKWWACDKREKMKRAEKEKLQSQLDLFQEAAEKEKDEALDEAYKEAEDKLENMIRQKEVAEAAKREAEERVASMETEIDELRMMAKQTALPDETELERIRKEAEASARKKAEEAMRGKLEKAKKDAEKAKKEADEANKAIEAYEAAQKEAEEAMVKAKEELMQVREETEKKLKFAGSSGITMFKVYFDTTQGNINQMISCIQSVEEAGEVEEAAKIRRALLALCQSVLDNL